MWPRIKTSGGFINHAYVPWITQKFREILGQVSDCFRISNLQSQTLLGCILYPIDMNRWIYVSFQFAHFSLFIPCIFLNQYISQQMQLTLTLLTWRIWWAPTIASKWQMGFNSAFKGLIKYNSWQLSNFYMFRHRGAIFRESSRIKEYESNTLILVLHRCHWND